MPSRRRLPPHFSQMSFGMHFSRLLFYQYAGHHYGHEGLHHTKSTPVKPQLPLPFIAGWAIFPCDMRFRKYPPTTMFLPVAASDYIKIANKRPFTIHACRALRSQVALIGICRRRLAISDAHAAASAQHGQASRRSGREADVTELGPPCFSCRPVSRRRALIGRLPRSKLSPKA